MVFDLSKGKIASFLLAGGLLNGLASRLAESWHEDGAEGVIQLFGVSPFEIVVCGIAVSWMLASSGKIGTRAIGLYAVGFMLITLVPSSLGSWVALLGYALWVAWHSTGGARRSALLFCGLAGCAIWWAMGERSIGGGLLDIDAAIAAGFLSMFMDGVQRAGNVISTSSGHKIVVLVGCSTAYGLPLSMLSMYALAKWNGANNKRRIVYSCLGLAASYAFLNIVRLGFLGISSEAYHIGHGAAGLGAFDATVTVLTVAVAWFAAQGGASNSHETGTDNAA